MKNIQETDKQKFTEIREKIYKGMALAFERLLEQKIKDDGYFVFSENGKIVHVRARDYYEHFNLEPRDKQGILKE